MKLLSTLFGALSLTAFTANASILPENNLHLEDHPMMIENMTEEEFVAIIERVEDYYAPIVAGHGGTLLIEKRWTDRTVNAYAQRVGEMYKVSMFGGLARRPEVTHDGFMLVVCHELGHHLAGFPFVSSWAADEGQSDYFATQSCARNLWKDDLATNATFRDTIDETAKASCDTVYTTEADQNLCYRTAMGGYSLARLLSKLGRQGEPSFATPDTSVVTKTNHRHPAGQCRLDTYLAGALCTVEFDENFIPGIEFKDEWMGKERKMETQALQYSCSQFNPDQAIAMRPTCWYAQKVNPDADEDEGDNETPAE